MVAQTTTCPSWCSTHDRLTGCKTTCHEDHNVGAKISLFRLPPRDDSDDPAPEVQVYVHGNAGTGYMWRSMFLSLHQAADLAAVLQATQGPDWLITGLRMAAELAATELRAGEPR